MQLAHVGAVLADVDAKVVDLLVVIKVCFVAAT